jgi:macrolide transport system ATP-binding/permease protein
MIHMRDGQIVSEERRARPPHGASAGALRVAQTAVQSQWRHNLRAFSTYFRIAGRALWAHKLRSLLSMLGILIGTASVVAMLAIGAGAKEAIRRQFSHLGSNVLILRPGARQTGAVRTQAGLVSRLTPEDARAIADSVPGVRRVSATVSTRAQAVFQNRNWNTEVTGVEPDHADIRAMQPTVGRYITEDDLRTRARVAVVGRTIVRELFEGRNPLGEQIRINRVIFQIVGVLPEKGASPWRDRDDVIIVPLTTAMYRLAGRDHVDSIELEIADAAQIPSAQQATIELMRRRLRAPPHAPDPIQVQNMAEMLSALTETSRTVSMLLAIIATISLAVGGIGVMNIMLVSVAERVREIGVRKAIGARRRDIQGQFLVEAIAVSLCGGVLGMVVGALVAYALSTFAGWATSIDARAVAIAFGCSALTGLIFGIWPARKAAQLNPIDALRYE